jgi:hypothetical protein
MTIIPLSHWKKLTPDQRKQVLCASTDEKTKQLLSKFLTK